MTAQEKALHIDIPVKLTEVKVVSSIASPNAALQSKVHGWGNADISLFRRVS